MQKTHMKKKLRRCYTLYSLLEIFCVPGGTAKFALQRDPKKPDAFDFKAKQYVRPHVCAWKAEWDSPLVSEPCENI